MDNRSNMKLPRSVAAIAAACVLSGMSAVALAGDLSEGKKVFTELAQPSCGICHTLADAGSTGKIGPDLDLLKPNTKRVYKAVTNGIGVMPPFKDKLSEAQRRAVAEYVSSVTGGG